MFGHRYFGARYFGPRYFGAGGTAAPQPQPEVPPTIPAGARRRGGIAPRQEIEVFRGTVDTVLGVGQITIIGHKAVEYPPDDEVLQFLGMI